MNGFIRGDATTNSINIFTVVNVTMTHRFMRVDGQSQPSIWIAVISSMRTMAFVYAPNVAATQVTNFLNSFHMCAADFFPSIFQSPTGWPLFASLSNLNSIHSVEIAQLKSKCSKY